MNEKYPFESIPTERVEGRISPKARKIADYLKTSGDEVAAMIIGTVVYVDFNESRAGSLSESDIDNFIKALPQINQSQLYGTLCAKWKKVNLKVFNTAFNELRKMVESAE